MTKFLRYNLLFSFLGLNFGTIILGLILNSSDSGSAGLYFAIYFIQIFLAVFGNILSIGLCNSNDNKFLKTLGLFLCPLTLVILGAFSSDFKIYFLWAVILITVNVALMQLFKDDYYS